MGLVWLLKHPISPNAQDIYQTSPVLQSQNPQRHLPESPDKPNRPRRPAEGLELDRKYLGSLLNDIHRERAKRANTWMLNQALSAFQDVMMEISAVAWEIANDQFTRKQDRVMALREVREAHKDMFEKLFDAGVFERKLGSIDATIRNTPLSEERKQDIRLVFENWGLLAAPKEDAEPTKPTDS
jgi:hypothetical protein